MSIPGEQNVEMDEFEPAVTKAIVAMGQMTCIHDRQHSTP